MTNIYVLPDRPSFPLGDFYVTAAVDRKLDQTDIWKALERHGQRDWGDVSTSEQLDNDESLVQGFRLFSVYHDRNGVKFWVITEADRSATTVLLPDDY
jgi:hypothetical protein